MKHKLAALITLILVLVAAVPASAQAPAPGVWNTGFTVRNMSFGASTSVYIEFFDSDGDVAADWYQATLGATSSVFLYSGNISGLPAETSAKVSSHEPVAVVANLASAHPKTESAYVSMRESETSTELFAPGVYKGYYGNSSAIRVQNAGSSTTCVRVRFYASGSSSVYAYDYHTVEPGAGYTFVQADASYLTTGWIGSARIDSVDEMGTCTDGEDGQALAAVTHITIEPGPHSGNPNPWRLHAIHNPIIEGDHIAYAPVLCNDYYGNKSALTVLNMRSSAQWVRVTYSDVVTTSEKSIAANSTGLWYIPNEDIPDEWLGTGTVECLTGSGGSVTTDCEIVATVNQINEDDGNFASYNGFTEADGQRISHLPVVVKKYAPDYGEYTTAITCMNVSTYSVYICLKMDGEAMIYHYVAPGDSCLWWLSDLDDPDPGYNGSAYVYGLLQPDDIICMAQQIGEDPTEDGDWLTTYNGVSAEYP